ncbi:hypothetical protein M5K25_007937 [Dendrobium thyrsiflorum]|uniref:Uncharacterized protein n=1 Tax=Dendrobium thyrsiflorum TaxID=117978 RepID=A0ABD0V8H2_DENTH
MAASETKGRAGRKVEVLEWEIGQTKSEISDLKKDISAIHDKFDSKFFIMKEMLKNVLESQTQKMPSEVREVTNNQGSGESPKPIRQREDQEVETQKEKERMPPLELVPMGEPGRGYGEKHEELEHEQMGA